MENKYDVGIYGWWGHDNFGGCLTYFALERTVKKMGYSVLMIQEGFGESPRYKILDECVAMKFANKHYDCSPQANIKYLNYYNDVCSKFIVGGDQMWNNLIDFVKEDNFLSFVNADKLKISYSTSFGTTHHNPPNEFLVKMKPLLQSFDNVSVRESYAIDLAKRLYGVEATQVIDAVFLLDKTEYIAIAEESEYKFPEKFLLAFILNANKEKRNQIEIIAKKLNLKIVCIPDAAVGYHKQFNEMFEGLEILSPLSVPSFLKAYHEASYIVTDSFHGTCMSYIFKKDFSVYFNEIRGSDRFVSLMELLQLDSRRIHEKNSEEGIINNGDIGFNVNWEQADVNVKREQEFSLNWLKNALETKDKINSKNMYTNGFIKKMINTTECIGCGACANICPTGAISLEGDKWGFYRAIVDESKCIGCGKCVDVCPILHHGRNFNSSSPSCYEFIAKDKTILHQSSSGGIFTYLAKLILEKKGIVCGAQWNTDFSVQHVIVDNEDELNKLRKSKYLQSYQGNIFHEIKTFLDNGRYVLYVGTPCHSTGLRNYLGKSYDKLIVVDLLCGNAPSTLFFQKYVTEQFHHSLSSYEFRTKVNNWNCTYVTIDLKNGEKIIRNGSLEDDYQRGFHNHTMCPEHCEKCKYQSIPRVGDLTIGDFWGISAHDSTIDPKSGVSVILCNNEKGESILNEITESSYLVKKKVPLSWLGGNGFAYTGKNFVSKGRDKFFDAILERPFSEAMNYALKPEEALACFNDSNKPLQYRASFTRFQFEHDYWEEHFTNNQIKLIVKKGKNQFGHYATLALCRYLTRNKKYKLELKFKIKTLSNIINFHMKDSGSRGFQVVYSYSINDKTGKTWNIVNSEFIVNSDIYDEFMIGAAQVSGDDNFIIFDYIAVSEV